MNAGLITGVGVNLYIWLSAIPIFWIWWNLIGAVITLSAALLLTALIKKSPKPTLERGKFHWFRTENFILVAFFVVMIVLCLNLPGLI
jgi:hypothetical protein